jgi:hypothetical protein
MPCIRVTRCRRFGRIYCLHIQCRRNLYVWGIPSSRDSEFLQKIRKFIPVNTALLLRMFESLSTVTFSSSLCFVLQLDVAAWPITSDADSCSPTFRRPLLLPCSGWKTEIMTGQDEDWWSRFVRSLPDYTASRHSTVLVVVTAVRTSHLSQLVFFLKEMMRNSVQVA